MIHALLLASLTSAAQPNYSVLMKAAHIPGMQVVVVDHGKVTENEAFGVRNLTSKTPVDVHTRFEIGSITKQFTAAAILQLREQGKLSLDDRLEKYIPAYAAGRNITLRQMLLQISGIPNFTETKAFGAFIAKRGGTYMLTRRGNIDGAIGLIANKKLDFTPGTKWEYSNTNYYLLGRVVEIASGTPWSAYVAQHIFKPAGMTESAFMDDEHHIADMATGYTIDKSGLAPTGTFDGWAGAAGSIVSTAGDLAKWDAALFGGKIVSDADLQLMTAPGPLPAMNGRYGFGWIIDTYDGQRRIWHNGGTLGFNSSNQVFPQTAQSIIVLMNAGNGADTVAQTTFDALHRDLTASQNAAAAGEDPAITARVKNVWAQLVGGHPDRTQFTDSFNKALTPQVLAVATQQITELGEPRTWVYRGKTAHGTAATYDYRVTFSTGLALHVHMSVDANGKIAGFWFNQ